MKKSIFIFCIPFFAACATGEHESIAHITQRRHKPGNKLMISYQFYYGSKLIVDSMEVQNRIVPHDSVKVVFSVENQHVSHLLLP